MFQFSGFAFLTEYQVFNLMGCPIRISTDQRLFAPHRSFSQLITSFIASESQGILHAPLLTFFTVHTVFSLHFYSRSLHLLLNITYIILFSFQYVNELFETYVSYLWRIRESNP
jgi:hypothetical protein